jgi:2-methylisocitrate lyase-like PEP mutase family enzyme
MATKFETFKTLHGGNKLFILPNAWDARSAQIFQESNYPAVGTSSAAVATSLGYADGENMPFNDYLLIIKRIAASVTVPVTIDMEMGYGKTADAIYSNLQKLVEAGVAGINIEDSAINNGVRSLKDAKDFARMIEVIKSKLVNAHESLFINVRCDTFILNVPDKSEETTKRLKLYELAGADGIFLPLIKDEQDIAQAVATTKLPLNVMAMPGLPPIDKLNELGVKRVSMGPFLHNAICRKVKELAVEVIESNSVNSITNNQ